MKGSKKGWRAVALAVAVSLAVLALLIYKVGVRFDRVLEQWASADKRLILASVALSCAWHVFLGTDKWYRILKRLGAPVTWLEIAAVRVGSEPIRFAAPFKTGELINACYLSARRRLDFARACSSIVFDKTLNLVGSLFWLLLGLAILQRLPLDGQSWDFLAMVAVAVGFFLLLVLEPLRAAIASAGGAIHPKLRRFIEGGLAPFREMTIRQKVFFLLYGALFKLRPILVMYLLFRAYGQKPAFNETLTYGSIAVLMSNMPLTLAGIGPREASIQLLFAAYGGPEVLISVGLLTSFAVNIAPALMGAPFAPRLLRLSFGAEEGASADAAAAAAVAEVEPPEPAETEQPDEAGPSAPTDRTDRPAPAPVKTT